MEKLLVGEEWLKAMMSLEVAGVNPAYCSWEYDKVDKDAKYIYEPSYVCYKNNDVEIFLYCKDSHEMSYGVEIITQDAQRIQQLNKMIYNHHKIELESIDENGTREYSYFTSDSQDLTLKAIIDLMNDNEVNYSNKRRKYMRQDLA